MFGGLESEEKLTNRVVYDGGIAEVQAQQQFNMQMKQEFGDLHHGSIVLYNGTYYSVRNNYDAGGQSNPIFTKMTPGQVTAAIRKGYIK